MAGSQGCSVLCEDSALQILEVVIHMVTLYFCMYCYYISVFISMIMFNYITL